MLGRIHIQDVSIVQKLWASSACEAIFVFAGVTECGRLFHSFARCVRLDLTKSLTRSLSYPIELDRRFKATSVTGLIPVDPNTKTAEVQVSNQIHNSY